MQRATRNAIGQRAGRRGRHRGRHRDAGRRGRAIRPVNTERAEVRRHGDCFSKLTRLGEGATSPARRAHGDDIGNDIGNDTCTRAAGDVGPYQHVQYTPCPRTMRTPCPRTMHTPCPHAMPACTMAPMVGRDVPDAPRPRGRHRERHQERHRHAGRRGRRPLPSCTMHTMSTHHAHAMPAPPHHARTPAPCPHAIPHAMVGRDVPGAPHPRGRHRGRHRGRGPPGTSAPTIMHNVRHVRTPCPTSCPHTRHVRNHGRARRPRRAAPTGTTSGTTSCTRAAGEQDGAGVFSRRRASNGGRTGRVP